jgi:hypothetical protein
VLKAKTGIKALSVRAKAKGLRRCRKCGKTKVLSKFKRSDGRGYCDNCQPTARKASQVKSEYGISLRDLESIRKAQGNKCAVCKGELKYERIDHDHITGKVRGLLCHRCNILAGFIEKTPGIVEKIGTYIQNAERIQNKRLR